MKKTGLFLLLAVLLPLLLLFVPSALAEAGADAPAEWTVLFYFCGSDLESKYSYATGNLEEIASVSYPVNYLPDIAEAYDVDIGQIAELGTVNILIETGGAKEWHTQDMAMDFGMDVDAGALQRWRYNYYPYGGRGTDDLHDGFELMETLPLDSMADPQTLSDFIRWGAETCPAKKYALVLWDHGEGPRTGLFVDELFEKDVLYLCELKEALIDADVQLEAVVIDACLMANLETAWSIKDSARWLVASEETVPGQGTAIGEWLQQLIRYPECDGEWLGRTICDTTLVKYVNESDNQSKSTLTWSVVDLAQIDPLIDAFERFFAMADDAIRRYPIEAVMYARYIHEAEEYGDGDDNMRDLADVAYNADFACYLDPGVRGDLLEALGKAVVYSVRGTGRSKARGLSFCYPTNVSPKDLDTYAQNFPMPAYLAYLDAIADWEAPGWVYEQVEPVPMIDSIEDFRLKVVKRMSEKGMPGLETDSLIDDVYYRLYRLDEETGDVLRLGRTNCGIDPWNEGLSLLYRATDPVHWPAVDGELFCMDLIQTQFLEKLYNVPVQIGSKNGILRCGRTIQYSEDGSYDLNEYEIYGLWEGFEENSTLLNRSVKPLSALVGQEYRFLYPVDGQEGGAGYQSSEPLTMYRKLDVAEIPLPEGTYYLEYEVVDMFMRSFLLDRIEFHWDGENMTFPEGSAWEGEVVLNAIDEK